MTNTAAADHATLEFIVITRNLFCLSFDYRWLVAEMRESIPKELGFLLEAKNSVRVLDNFRKLSPHIANYVYAPKVYSNLSISKLLVMEFMDGAQVNDVKTIRKLDIQPNEVSRLAKEAYLALIFADANAIRGYRVKLGAGEDLYVLFAGVLTLRPRNRVPDPAVDHLVIQGTDRDHSELQLQ